MSAASMPRTELRERLYEWCSIALIQADRLGDSWDDLRDARRQTANYAYWIEQGRPAEQEAFIRANGRRLTFGQRWRLNADIQAFLNAAGQVWKVVRDLGQADYAVPPEGAPIHAARNYEEHWEGPKEWTTEAVEAALGGLETKPGISWEIGHDLWVGGAPLGGIADWIRNVQRAVAVELRGAGLTVPSSRTHVYRAPRAAK